MDLHAKNTHPRRQASNRLSASGAVCEIDKKAGRIPEQTTSLGWAAQRITDADIAWVTNRHNQAFRSHEAAKERVHELAAQFCACEPASPERSQPYEAMAKASTAWAITRAELAKATRLKRALEDAIEYREVLKQQTRVSTLAAQVVTR